MRVFPGTNGLRRFEYSVSTFPPLSNVPRMYDVPGYRDPMGHTARTDEVSTALDVVGKHGPSGIDAEPQEWRLLSAMAVIYQQAGGANGEYLVRARRSRRKGGRACSIEGRGTGAANRAAPRGRRPGGRSWTHRALRC